MKLGERLYLCRRADGELMYGEWSHSVSDAPHDWDHAAMESEGSDGPVEYEMVEVEVISVRTRVFDDGRRVGSGDDDSL